MNSKTALCQCLLRGEIINVRNIHSKTGYTNASREIIRQVERLDYNGFGILTKRTRRDAKNRYGVHCFWIDYSLPQNPANKEGIKKMKEYIKQNKKRC
jgi:YD repeat-containing protein